MTLDRSKWLAVRQTPRKLTRGKWLCVAIRTVMNPDGSAHKVEIQGTYSPGRNRLKRYVGTGKQRRKARKAMQRAKRAEQLREAA